MVSNVGLVFFVTFAAMVANTLALDMSASNRRASIRGSKIKGTVGTKRKTNQNRRKAKKGGKGGSSHPSHSGCMGLSSDNMDEYWIFDGDAPSCSYVHYNSTDDGSSSGGGNGNGSDDGDGNGGNNGGGNGNGREGDGNGDNYDEDGDEQVVTQEEVADGQYDPYDDFILERVSRKQRFSEDDGKFLTFFSITSTAVQHV